MRSEGRIEVNIVYSHVQSVNLIFSLYFKGTVFLTTRLGCYTFHRVFNVTCAMGFVLLFLMCKSLELEIINNEYDKSG